MLDLLLFRYKSTWLCSKCSEPQIQGTCRMTRVGCIEENPAVLCCHNTARPLHTASQRRVLSGSCTESQSSSTKSRLVMTRCCIHKYCFTKCHCSLMLNGCQVSRPRSSLCHSWSDLLIVLMLKVNQGCMESLVDGCHKTRGDEMKWNQLIDILDQCCSASFLKSLDVLLSQLVQYSIFVISYTYKLIRRTMAMLSAQIWNVTEKTVIVKQYGLKCLLVYMYLCMHI